MTLAEKIGQMSQLMIGRNPLSDTEARIRQGLAGSCLNAASVEQRNHLQRLAVEESRLGIPLLFGRDVIHGFRTMLPIPLAQASSFDTALVEEGARLAAREASAEGVDWAFGPVVDVTRDPRWGRIAETSGEDPFLAAQLARAVVRGLQGADFSDRDRVIACAKHFLAYGAVEAGKDYNTITISEQNLREVHLPSFRACIEEGVGTVMSAFNEINGVPATANRFTLRDLLKGELAFDGFVVSDCSSVVEIVQHGFCTDERAAAREAASAGIDMEMATSAFITHLEALTVSGELVSEVVEEAVRRVLRIKFRRGLFEHPYPRGSTSRTLPVEHRGVAQRLAEESAVLLKNRDAVLPLSPELRSLAVIGCLANAPLDQMGCWTLDGRTEDVVTPLAALRSRFPAIRIDFAPGIETPRSRDSSGIEAAVAAARAAEVVLLFVGEDQNISGESKCRAFLDLPGIQSELVAAVADAAKQLVLIVMSGRPLVIDAALERADAVLWAWHNGTMGGPALVNLLFGARAPSGKLPVSFPRTVGQIPIYYSHKATGRPPKAEARAGIPIGTPIDPIGFSTCHLDVESSPLFPFGFGLTYGTVEYSDLVVVNLVVPRNGTLEVHARLRCHGARPIEEVAQLYVRDLVGSVTRPVRELKGFQRVALAPNEAKTVRFRIPASDLAFPGRDGALQLEPGDFHVWVGGCSDATLQGEFSLA